MNKWLLIIGMAYCTSVFGLDQASLAQELEEARTEMKMPGLRAAVRFPDGGIVRAAVGVADRETGNPLDDTIGMPGGSTGKTFAASLALLLVEDGTLSLDDPAARWLAETDWYAHLPNADSIRVRHLLSHSSGIADYPELARWHAAMVWRVLRQGSAYFTPEELIGYALDRKAPFPAGQGYRYSDTGYLVLGRLLEAAAGRDYYELLRERILQPQKLTDVRPQDASVLTGIATGYMGGGRNLKKDGRMKFDPRSEWTGGGLITTPTMLAQFYGALAEGRIVKPESLDRMLNGGWRNPETPEWHYGFGLFVADDGSSFSHGGLWPGYRTYVTHFLTTGITVAVQTNRDGKLALAELTRRIAKMAASSANSEREPVGRRFNLSR